ncbi:type IV pilus secretin PilQ [Aquincola sp. MAHUQ-54]|uniref:Type IV pilus biogenesis and competence protein PilQ n=1 Tax=Aquincola agrisoli TaxID=3119538 RepID=A0AAW9QLX7_9BURK
MKNDEEKRIMTPWKALCTAIVLAVGVPIAALAQTMIQSITSTQQAGSEVVRIELSEPLAAVPAGFAVQAPPRIAIDLPGVGSALPRSSVELNQGNLRSVNVARGGDRTRLVLNLKQAATYRAQIEGKALLILVDSAGPAEGVQAAAPAAPAAPDAPVHFAQPLNADPLSLRDIDFRRGQDGAGRVIVNLPNNQVGVDIRQQGQQLVVEFLRSTLPDRLRRRLDVADFGTPVTAISTVQSGDRVRMTIEPRGAWEHSAYQSDNQFVVEVRPMVIDPNKLVQGPGYAGEKLSLNFQNIEVRALLQVIADFTNFNVVTSDTVTGTVTLRLKDVPWDQALDIIMQAKGLGLRKSGNVLWIAPKDELSAKEQVELEAKKKIADLEPVRTQSFQLNYTKAEEVAKGLTGQNAGQGGGGGGSSGGSSVNTRILSPRGSVIYETRTNQLFVSDIPSKLEEVQAIIAKIDIPVRQVLIEARIVEADDTFGRALGVRLGASDLRGRNGGIPGWSVGGSNYVTVGGGYNAINGQTLQSTLTEASPGSLINNRFNNEFVNLPANVTNLGGAQAATFALSLFSASANRFLNLELSALEADGKGKIVSSPRVITADQIKAVIEQGEEIPYQVATSSGATSVQFRKASLKLEVVPQITPEGNVILDVDVAKDSRGATTNAGPAINTKHVKTQVLVENGGTVVLGGIFTQEERDDVNKVPLLGDIPVVGNLFKNTVRSSNKTELLVFITPKVVTDRVTAR